MKHLSTLIGVVVFAFVLLQATLAHAAEAIADQTAVSQITQIAIEILIPVITAFLIWAVHRIIKVFEKKTGIDVPDKQEAKIDEWIQQGITLAAEKSYKKVKEKTEALKGPEKLEIAADYVHRLAIDRGWLEWTKEKIKAKLEAKLGEKRIDDAVPKLEKKAEA